MQQRHNAESFFGASVVMRKGLGNVFKTNYTDFSMVSTSLQLSLTQKYEEKASSRKTIPTLTRFQ